MHGRIMVPTLTSMAFVIVLLDTIPKDASGRTIHVLLEVVDTGNPPLVAYRRVVLTVSGKPALSDG